MNIEIENKFDKFLAKIEKLYKFNQNLTILQWMNQNCQN